MGEQIVSLMEKWVYDECTLVQRCDMENRQLADKVVELKARLKSLGG